MVARFGDTSNVSSHLKKSNLVVEMDIEMGSPNPSTYQVYFRGPKDGAKMVAGRVDTKPDEAMTLTAASPVNIGSSRFVRLGNAASNGLKIR